MLVSANLAATRSAHGVHVELVGYTKWLLHIVGLQVGLFDSGTNALAIQSIKISGTLTL